MPIKRKHIKHGDVVEIKLPNLKVFSYCKVVEPKKFKEQIDLPHFLRIYKQTFIEPVQQLNNLDRELLLAPFFLIGGSAAITKFGWRIVSDENVSQEEEWLPDTKEGWPLLSKPPEKWGYKMGYSTHLVFTEEKNVKHLDNAKGKNIEIISFLIEMELLKCEGKDIQKEFGIQGWLEQSVYNDFIELPAYSNLAKEHRGKAVVQ